MLNIENGELAVVLGPEATPAEIRSTELLADRIKERTGLELALSADKAKVRLVIGTVASSDEVRALAADRNAISELGPDGYSIVNDATTSELYVIGESASGVLAGIGRLMREMRYAQGTLGIPELDICEAPRMSLRGMYLWARKYYFDQPDQVDRYIEEMALWGCNAICLWFELAMFNDFTATGKLDENSGYGNHMNKRAAPEYVAMYRRFFDTARRLGMKTGLLMVPNDAYRSSPEALRIEPIIGCPNCYLCPSKPGAVEQMVAWQEEVVKALSPIDMVNLFPADPGGCDCDDCKPWPTRGLWKAAKPLGERIHAISPETEIWVDTWHLNHPTFGDKDWKNLVLDIGNNRPEWVAGLEVGLAPHHQFAASSAEERDLYNQVGLPLMVFPDISMWGLHKGMMVKQAYWKELQAELNDYDPKLMKGGWPYAERWNTDIACYVFLSFFWNPKRPVESILDDYATLFFGPEAETGRKLIDLLDDGNSDPERTQKIQNTLATLTDSAPEWVKRDWRWSEILESCSRFE